MDLSRIWDTENKRKQKAVIVVKSKERGARTKVTACCYSPDGKQIGGGASVVFDSMERNCSCYVRSMLRRRHSHMER